MNGKSHGVESIAAEDAVAAEEPQIPELADRRPRRYFGYGVGRVVSVLGYVLEHGNPQVDLGGDVTLVIPTPIGGMVGVWHDRAGDGLASRAIRASEGKGCDRVLL